MFGLFKKKEEFITGITAPQNGKIVPISEVSDEAFSEKMLGDGVATYPTDGKVLSPVNGTISYVASTGHAIALNSDDGLEILIHIGINTVELDGEGLKTLVKDGDKVKVGDPIADIDLEFIRSKGYETYTPVVITNMDVISVIQYNICDAVAGETIVFTYKKK